MIRSMNDPGVVVPWHLPLSLTMSVFLIVSCLVFLATFRPVEQRNAVAGALVWFALGIIAWALPPLYRAWLTDLPPTTYTSGWHAASTLVGRGCATIAVLHLLIWQARARYRPRTRYRLRRAVVAATTTDEQQTPEEGPPP